MTHTYTVTGMTCKSCEAKVREAFLSIDNVTNVSISKEHNTATITMNNHIDINVLAKVLADKYTISAVQHNEVLEQTKSWFATYKPVLLIFLYLFAATSLFEVTSNRIDFMRWMRHFMAGFFLTFSFFKMLNLKGFHDSYKMYDVIAKKIPAWGYVYAFSEAIIGFALMMNFKPIATNTVTLVLMTLSIIGVLQSVLNKKTIKCACLGDVFNLPMSTVTIIEDGLMIVMSMVMLYLSIEQ